VEIVRSEGTSAVSLREIARRGFAELDAVVDKAIADPTRPLPDRLLALACAVLDFASSNRGMYELITVAAGVFAPGHLGELTRVVPFELADAVLEEEGGLEKRVRLLPSRCGLYFLLAMCLFPQSSYLGVWGKLTSGLRELGIPAPSAKALRDLRRRIGVRPVKRLAEVLAGPLGLPRTPGIMFGGYRTVSLGGCR
jgi:hypothetical protein